MPIISGIFREGRCSRGFREYWCIREQFESVLWRKIPDKYGSNNYYTCI